MFFYIFGRPTSENFGVQESHIGPKNLSTPNLDCCKKISQP